MKNNMMIQKGKLAQNSVPRVGLGCMGMSEFYGKSDEYQNLAILDKAVEIGYRHFDTADMYGMGANECLLGKFIKRYSRYDLFLASKFGIKRNANGEMARTVDGSTQYVREACEKSLDRLGVDYLDLYYVHRRDPATPIEETIGILAELVQEGLIREIGLSEVSVETYLQAQAIHPIAAIQTEYSLLSLEPEDGMLQACKDHNTAFVAYSPMSRGLLSGMLNLESVQKQGDTRQFMPRFNQENINHNLALVAQLNLLAQAKECSLAQIALAWVLHQGEHIHIIPGTRTEKYLFDNFQSMSVFLSQDELSTLREYFHHNVAGARYPQIAMTGINE
ncbi:aldo/keto reductase [Neisseria sp. Ec49-e6-T10]|uniref:aldo/keto reductase n=1 Tax=Neisseria sp. Ec49-e6-T10 TaxID=3140744 RepID=UPI003EC08192